MDFTYFDTPRVWVFDGLFVFDTIWVYMWKLHSRTSKDEIEHLLWYLRCYVQASLRTKINNLAAGGNFEGRDK